MKYRVDRIKALQSLPVSSAILDSAGEILAVNEGWKEFGRRNGLTLPAFGVGQSYLDYCGEEFGQNLGKLLAGELDILTRVYPCNATEDQRWFFMLCMPLSLQRPCEVAVVHANLTALLPLPLIEVGVVAEGVEGAIEAALATQLQSMRAQCEMIVLSRI